MSNFKNVYILLLFRLVIALIIGSLTALVVSSGFGFLRSSAEVDSLRTSVIGFFDCFFKAGGLESLDTMLREAVNGVATAFGGVIVLLTRHLGGIILSVLAFVFFAIVARFLNGLALFSFGDVLNDKMSQFTKTPFFVGFFHNLPQAALYQVVYVPLAFVYDALTVVGCYFLFFRLFFFIPAFFSLFLSAVFLLSAQALKLAFISDWMPAIIADGKKMTVAMQESFRLDRTRFAEYFSTFLTAAFCIMAVNVLFAVATFGSALLLTVPGSFAFLICLQFVNYYSTRKKRYFLNYDYISGKGSFPGEE